MDNTMNPSKNRFSSANRHSSPRLILLIISMLTVLTVGLAIVDYYNVRNLTYELAVEQAVGLIRQVENTVQRATIAEESVRLAITDQLFAVGFLVELWIEDNNFADPDLAALSLAAGVSRIDIFNSNGQWQSGNHGSTTEVIGVPTWHDTSRGRAWIQGLYGGTSEEDYYGIVIRQQHGDYIRVGVRAIEMLAIRQELGPGSLLLDLARQPEVYYAVLDSKEGLIAATNDLPAWVEQPGDPYHDRALAADDFQAKFLQTPDGPLFEAYTPFGEDGNMVLRLGLHTDHLQLIRQRNVWALVIRSALFILLSTTLAAYIISRQNIRYLENERQKILREIRILEADRTLQERLTAMGELAGGVAHEIRNPLNTVIMASQRLEREIDPLQQPDQYRTVVAALQSEARRIERIVSDFLSFARPPRARKSSSVAATELQPVVETFRQLAEGHQISFDVDLQPLPKFALDGDLLRQAVLNLLKNALEAVSTESGVILLKGYREQNWAVFEVTDNGSGIPPDLRQQVFDLYFTTKATGTGIGLPLVHRIAMEHQGRVEIDQSQSDGTCIRLYMKMEQS
jgi:signal transduction histidine kinase